MSAAAEKLALLRAKREAREEAAAKAATEVPATKALRELRVNRSTAAVIPSSTTVSSSHPPLGADVVTPAADGKESSEQTLHMEEEINRLRTQMAESEQKKVMVQTELDTTRDLMGAQTTKHENECARLKHDNESLHQQLIELKEKAMIKETEIKRINDKNNELSMHATATAAGDNAKALNDSKRIADMEAQINELMDNLEMLTLDKEQLVVDNEMLQAQLEDLTLSSSQHAVGNVTSNSNTVGTSADLADENAKLREALRRLHQQSTNDKSEWDTLKQQCNDDRLELETLRVFKSRADQEMTDLRQAVDAAGSYESIIESLTEKNLMLMQRTAELEVTVHDVEEQHELSEELDRQQRLELDILRRKLDSANINAAEKDSTIKGLENKLEEFKKINEKFRHSGEELRTELNELRGQVTMSAAESHRARLRARATASSHSAVDRLRETATTLRCQLVATEEAKKQAQAMHVRLFAVFGRCSLHATEDPLLSCEVSVVHTASMGSVVSQTAVNFLIECLTTESMSTSSTSTTITETSAPPPPITTGKIATRSRASSKSVPVETLPAAVNTTTTKLITVVEKVRTHLLSKVLILLRATCLSWQSVGAVLATTGTNNIKDSLHVDVTNIMFASNNLYRCFEQALGAIVTAQHFHQLQVVHVDGDADGMFTSTFDDQLESNNHIFSEVTMASNKLEHLLSAHLTSLGILSVPSLRSFEELSQSSPSSINSEPSTYTNADNGVWILQQFHTACQLSYFATSSDLLAHVVHAQLTVQSMQVDDKSTTSNSTLVSMLDLCTRLRSDLSATGLLTPSSERGSGPIHLSITRNRIIPISTGVIEGIEDDDRQQAHVVLKTIGQSLLACFTNLSHVLASSVAANANGEEDSTILRIPRITISPAQLRVCLSDIGSIKDCLVTTNSGGAAASTATPNTDNDSNPFRLKMVHYACKGEEDVLWQLLLDHPAMQTHTSHSHSHSSSHSHSHVIISSSSGTDMGSRDKRRSEWMALAAWRERAQEFHNQLTGWEQSQEGMTNQHEALQLAQRTLKERTEELRTALAANTEMQQILQTPTVASTSSSNSNSNTGERGEEILTQMTSSSSSTRRSSRRTANVEGVERDGGGDITQEKLHSEIKILTTALSVLEIQFENAEKENKRLRNANVASGSHRGGGTGSTAAMKPNSDAMDEGKGSEMVSHVAARARIWRSLASHRLLASMKPLPLLPSTLLSPFPTSPSSPSITSSLLPAASSSGPNEGREVSSMSTIGDPLKTYRDLRKLRSTVKVIQQQTKRGSRGGPNPPTTTIATALAVCFSGQEQRRDRLIDFFT